MRLSIVIPALNEAAHIERAVRSAWQAGAAEVLVVDGGSSDATCDISVGLACTLLRSERGRAVQQNAGAEAATGGAPLFLHADNWLESSQTAEQIAAVLERPHRLHGALTQRIDAPGLAYRLLELGNAARVRVWGLPYGDQAIFIRRETFWQLGGFPHVPLLEDLMLMQKLRRLAWPVLLPLPVVVSPRGWQAHGAVRQTLRNWRLLARNSLGASPESLAEEYRRHDQPTRQR